MVYKAAVNIDFISPQISIKGSFRAPTITHGSITHGSVIIVIAAHKQILLYFLAICTSHMQCLWTCTAYASSVSVCITVNCPQATGAWGSCSTLFHCLFSSIQPKCQVKSLDIKLTLNIDYYIQGMFQKYCVVFFWLFCSLKSAVRDKSDMVLSRCNVLPTFLYLSWPTR